MGASDPFAAAIVLVLAEAGAHVAVTSATPDAEEAFALRKLAKRISDLGRRSLAESVDLSLGASVQITIRQVAKALGRIDLLVIASDLRLGRPAERLSDADWSKVINQNLGAVFYACRGVAREMLRQEPPPDEVRGRIIVLTPSPEALAVETDAAYAAAKGGASALVSALAREWAGQGIFVSELGLPHRDAENTREVATLALELASAQPVASPSSR
jgi:NAD(P)-dependent dehydrogenase (short-subunit alcohol dehydrogenase family)